MNSKADYAVRIAYREPTYELRAGRKKYPYFSHYLIRTGTREEAVDWALSSFYGQARTSWVSWVRVVKEVRVRTIRSLRVV